MNIRLLSAIALALALPFAISAQDAPAPQTQPQGAGEWQGAHGGHGGWGNHGGLGDSGITGTVTAVAAGHYVVKTDAGESYTVNYTADTRILKQTIRSHGDGGDHPPPSLKPEEIKAGDVIATIGDRDAASKTISAALILLIDPERVKEMREMQANFGKTWLMGKVTAIHETTVTLLGSVDQAAHAFIDDENTTFRKRRIPITLADLQVGDLVRVEGAVKNGNFVATSVSVMEMPPGGMQHLRQSPAPPPVQP
ncbi:MAG: DUF5666 domain-containing protein [Terracidiphilus sp.]|jgi:hypothetical protein